MRKSILTNDQKINDNIMIEKLYQVLAEILAFCEEEPSQSPASRLIKYIKSSLNTISETIKKITKVNFLSTIINIFLSFFYSFCN
jgi:predicted PurR-regulated permease PerM